MTKNRKRKRISLRTVATGLCCVCIVMALTIIVAVSVK